MVGIEEEGTDAVVWHGIRPLFGQEESELKTDPADVGGPELACDIGPGLGAALVSPDLKFIFTLVPPRRRTVDVVAVRVDHETVRGQDGGRVGQAEADRAVDAVGDRPEFRGEPLGVLDQVTVCDLAARYRSAVCAGENFARTRLSGGVARVAARRGFPERGAVRPPGFLPRSTRPEAPTSPRVQRVRTGCSGDRGP